MTPIPEQPRRLRKFFRYALLLLLSACVICFSCNWYVNSFSGPFIRDEIGKLPAIRYGLLPGTSKYFARNDRNTFYQSRINAAFLLYKFKKVKKIIVSGTAEKYYNEPRQLRADLRKLGIPDSNIVSDTGGIHTLQSVEFLHKMNADSVIVISQQSQVQRAVFLARKSGIAAFGYAAPDPIEEHNRVRLREFFAKVKTVWDSWTKL